MQLAALEVSWGISAEAEDKYLILEELSAPGSTRWFSARERLTGIRRWLEAAPDAAEQTALAAVAAKLGRLGHPHILAPAGRGNGFIAYEWRGEAPFGPRSLGSLAALERVRLAGQLVQAVEYLHGQPSPITHGALGLQSLWVAPAANWLRLAGFTADAATPETLQSETSACLNLVEELITGPGAAMEHLDGYNLIRDEFDSSGKAPWDGLRATLTAMYVGLVTEDL